MKRLQAIDCAWPLVKRVQFDAQPRAIADGGIFAVFTASGDFYGLVAAQTAREHPERRLGDLVAHQPLARVKPTSSLAHCLRLMKKHRQDSLPIIDANGRFLGVVTQTSLLHGLVRQENLLLRKAEHYLQAAEEKHQQLEQWSERLAELQTASRVLLHVLSHTSIEKDLLQAAIEALARLLDARYGAIAIFGPEVAIGEFVTTGIGPEVAARIGAPPTGKGLLGVVIQQDHALRLDDLTTHPQSAGFPPHHPPMKSLLAVPISRAKRVYGRIYLCDKTDGQPFTAEDELLASSFSHSLSLILDNAQEIEKVLQTTQRLDHLAHHDPLTGLPNPLLLRDRLDIALLQTQRRFGRVAVLLIDLDDFKRINDVLGHSIGNALLTRMAQRLTDCVREGDTVARGSGDEFVVLLQDIDASVDAVAIAEKMLAALAAPCQVDDHRLFVTASIGISLAPDDADNAEDLLRFADTAMFDVKQAGGNGWRFFTAAMNERLHAHVRMESALRQALTRDELTLVYQPQVEIASGRIVGAEALLRWHSAELGTVPPSSFIPVAEATGQIMAIGDWVMATACAEAKRWLDAGHHSRLAVNVSARQFRHQDFIPRVRAILAASGLPPEMLELELTESLLIDAESEVIATLTQLRELGVQVSIDDFGTGYSSLSRLKKFPVGMLKIDQSFVSGIGEDEDAAAIAKTVIALGHSLRLDVIAEGVETPAHLAFLREHRCDIMQGYLFSRPLAADDFLGLLAREPRNGKNS